MLFHALQKVFRNPAYVLLALILSLAVFALAVWLPNSSLIAIVVSSSDIPFFQKLGIPLTLLGSIITNFTVLSAFSTIAIAILFGVNVAMLVYFLRRKISEVKQTGITTGFLGITSGIIGIGCAACGSFLLTSVLSLFGASSMLAFLPLAGGEFGILGVILLMLSTHGIAKQIQQPAVCKI